MLHQRRESHLNNVCNHRIVVIKHHINITITYMSYNTIHVSCVLMLLVQSLLRIKTIDNTQRKRGMLIIASRINMITTIYPTIYLFISNSRGFYLSHLYTGTYCRWITTLCLYTADLKGKVRILVRLTNTNKQIKGWSLDITIYLSVYF